MENEAKVLEDYMRQNHPDFWSGTELYDEALVVAHRLETAAQLDAESMPTSAFQGLKVEHVLAEEPQELIQTGVRVYLAGPGGPLKMFISSTERVVYASTPMLPDVVASISERAAKYIMKLYALDTPTMFHIG